MNIIMRMLAAAAICLLPLSAMASTWTIDPDHSNIQFKIRHMMITDVKGTFAMVKDVIRIDDNEITDPLGNIRRGASATATINRNDFGLNWNKSMESGGGMMLGDTVFISLEIEMIKDQGAK
jgi:polyisoprenoid-binding protein YceI